MTQQVPFSANDWPGLQFLARFFGLFSRFADQIVFTNVLVTAAARSGEAVPGGKTSRAFVDSRDNEGWITPDTRLQKQAAIARGEILLLFDETQGRGAEGGASLTRRR